MIELVIGIIPFIINTKIIGDNLTNVILFLLGLIFVIKNKIYLNKNRERNLFIGLILILIISQFFISPYIESFSGIFIYLNIILYFMIYKNIITKGRGVELIRYAVLTITSFSIIYIVYQGLIKNIRINGNMGYANSYALILLITLYLNEILIKEKLKNEISIVLLLGILYTGSRATLILSIIYFIYKCYSDYINKKGNIILSFESLIIALPLYILMDTMKIYSILVIPVIVMIYYFFIKKCKFKDKVYYLVLGGSLVLLPFLNNNTINRIKNISFKLGTLQERLVYYEDSIKAIITNPFGNGINMFQYKLFDNSTAFYDVKYIHNSYLQIIYDIGIVLGIIYIAILIYGLIRISKSNVRYKWILILSYLTIMIHGITEFNFSFSSISILIVLLIVISIEDITVNKRLKNEIKEEKNNIIKKFALIILAVISLYFLVFESALLLGDIFKENNNKVAIKLYNVANNISFKRDFRGYFKLAASKRLEYEESKNNNYITEGISLLEESKKINPYNPMIEWNLAYLHKEIKDEEKAISYFENLLEREKFYPRLYINYHDYLMELYGQTSNDFYLDKMKRLEEIYYKNYENINRKSIYMKNQLKENYDDIRTENPEYNINLNVEYKGEVKYFDQDDEKWSNYPYKDKENPISLTGCGVTAMAIVQSTLKEKELNPIEFAKYSIENNYCNNNTEVEFFEEVVKEKGYELKVENFEIEDISKVKRALSEEDSLTIVLMRNGDVTTEGHYLVLYGIETIDGVNYFKAMDPKRNNQNYKNNGNIIYSSSKDGFIKIRSETIFKQGIEFWVYKNNLNEI